jgi:hypothetical protein
MFRYLLITILGLWALVVHADEVKIERIPKPPNASSQLLRSLGEYESSQRRLLKECREQVVEWKRRDPASSVGLMFDLRYEVLWSDSRFYTLVSRLNIFCAGPYEAFAERGLNFDRITGKKYDPLRLYRLTSRGDKNTGDTIKPEVREMIRSALLKARGSQPGDDCVETLKQDDITFFDQDPVALTNNGMMVFYSGPNVVKACYDNVVLPYERLKRFLDREEARRVGWGESVQKR